VIHDMSGSRHSGSTDHVGSHASIGFRNREMVGNESFRLTIGCVRKLVCAEAVLKAAFYNFF